MQKSDVDLYSTVESAQTMRHYYPARLKSAAPIPRPIEATRFDLRQTLQRQA